MRILLVNFVNFLQTPFPEGVALLSTILRNNGFEIELFDTAFLKPPSFLNKKNTSAGISFYKTTEYSIGDLIKDDPVIDIDQQFIDVLQLFEPDIVAVSTMTTNYQQSVDLIKKAKLISNKPFRVIFGGVHPTLMPDEVMKEDIIDYVCIGEGEEMLLEVCNTIKENGDLRGIKNLCLKIGSGESNEVVKNSLRPFIDLNTLPTPDLSIFDERYFFKPFQGVIYRGIFLSTSRGCPRGCSYCVNNHLNRLFESCGQNRIRFQAPTIVAKHISLIKKKYDINWIRFSDDTFLMRPLEDLCEMTSLLKPLNIMFGCAVDPVTVTEEKVSKIKEMGCVSMSIGIETGNESIRHKILGRKISNNQIRKAIQIIKAYDIKISAFNMIGLPGETCENVFETIRFNKELGIPDANLYILYPFPGTKIYNDYVTHSFNTGHFPSMDEAPSFNLSKMTYEELNFFFRCFNLFLVLPESYWDKIWSSREISGSYDELVKIAQEIVDKKNL